MIHPTLFPLIRRDASLLVQLLHPADGVRSPVFAITLRDLVSKDGGFAALDHDPAVIFLGVHTSSVELEMDPADLADTQAELAILPLYRISSLTSMVREFDLSKAVSSLPEATQEATHE